MARKRKNDQHFYKDCGRCPHRSGEHIRKPPADCRRGQSIRSWQQDGSNVYQRVSEMYIASVRSVGYVENVGRHDCNHGCEKPGDGKKRNLFPVLFILFHIPSVLSMSDDNDSIKVDGLKSPDMTYLNSPVYLKEKSRNNPLLIVEDVLR
jgi:hypothetical protein